MLCRYTCAHADHLVYQPEHRLADLGGYTAWTPVGSVASCPKGERPALCTTVTGSVSGDTVHTAPVRECARRFEGRRLCVVYGGTRLSVPG